MRSAAVVLMLLAACQPKQQVVVDPSRPGIDPQRLTEVLDAQFARSADAWNRGDLQGFLSDYAADSLTTFVDGRRPQKGVAWIRDHYAPAFGPGAPRDSLRFEEFSARPLSTTLALVTARYVLYRGGAVTSSGPFTLVMEEKPDGWKILHDHTSSDPR
jgi:beta-aspartyl-peptidase (threonine type)